MSLFTAQYQAVDLLLFTDGGTAQTLFLLSPVQHIAVVIIGLRQRFVSKNGPRRIGFTYSRKDQKKDTVVYNIT